MPLAALEQGTDWGWETFGEYLDPLDGNLAVNAGFLVGHCAIRRYVMGGRRDRQRGHAGADARADARRARPQRSTPGHWALVHRHSRARTATATASPSPAAGPTPTSSSRCARRPAPTPGTTLEGIVAGLSRHVLRRRDRAARQAQRGGRPTAELERAHRRRPRARPDPAPARRQHRGHRARGQASSRSPCRSSVPMNMSFLNFCALWLHARAGRRSWACRWPSVSSASPIPTPG